MRGQPVHNTRPYAQLLPGCPGMDYLTTERSIHSQAMRVIDVFAYYLTCYHWGFV